MFRRRDPAEYLVYVPVMLTASGVDERIVIGGVVIGVFVVVALTAFLVSWIRSTPTERKRWSYRGGRDHGEGLGPTFERWRGRHRGS
ncbi:MAG TPA: hypothetical protein VGJ59_07855 [Jatrophihabitantaceae bacterium]|jgi:hypothetical protein